MKVLLRILLSLVGLVLVAVIFIAIIFRDRRLPIYFALERGDTNYIAKYLASGSNVNQAILCYPFGGNRNAPLLDIAVEYGQISTVAFLLERRANPNQHDYTGETPLMWSIGVARNDVSRENRMIIFKMLLDAGADPNLRSSSGFWTPLIYAAALDQPEMVSTLLSSGAHVNATNSEGQTALQYTDEAEIARLLIASGADATNRMGGETPIESAIRRGQLDVLTVLTNTAARAN